jgi:CTP synthase
MLLKGLGLRVTAIKIDPYINIDAGTMSPYEHGECYVLGDGGEVDLDLGNYERFLDLDLSKDHNITSGKIYDLVIEKERNGQYLGETVQIVPHIVNEIQNWIRRVSCSDSDICIIELGGTIGDMETAPFLEALRRLSIRNKSDFCFVHVSLIVDNGEPKTKPTQDSICKLRSLGIIPNFLVLRTKNILNDSVLNKLEMASDIDKNHIICNVDVPNIYFVPDVFKKQRFCEKICKHFGMEIKSEYSLNDYYRILDHYTLTKPPIRVGIAGKYLNSQDTYLSLIRAIEHASFKIEYKVEIVWIDTENLDWDIVRRCDRVIIPGGFGHRGIDGKLMVCRFCRENNIKTLGICLGMHVMVVEYARFLGHQNVCSGEWNDNDDKIIDSSDDKIIDSSDYKIIDILPDQNGKMGGTMRLGNYESMICDDTIKSWYGNNRVIERHRHRYELTINNFRIFKDSRLKIAATNNDLVEIVRLDDHPFFVGCQYHPEFKSRFNKPHPLFVHLLL